jgi:excisionase family DNA binding protein
MRQVRARRTLEGNREKATAFSTGQAARFCYVTSETILNWIHAGLLKGQRTAGGQFRIRLEDLRRFMIESGMDTRLIDEEKDVRPYCWEFHCQVGPRADGAGYEVCQRCLVRSSGTANCWQLRGLLPPGERRFDRCQTCDYHNRFFRSRELD